MGKDLLMSNTVAQETIKRLDGVLDTVDCQRSWTLRGKSLVIPVTGEHRTDFFQRSYFDRNRLPSFGKQSTLNPVARQFRSPW
jgi:hypothetical protein